MLVFEFKTYDNTNQYHPLFLAEGLSFDVLRINSTANGTLMQFAATWEVFAQALGLVMLLLFWIGLLLLVNYKSALNALDFSDILSRRFV